MEEKKQTELYQEEDHKVTMMLLEVRCKQLDVTTLELKLEISKSKIDKRIELLKKQVIQRDKTIRQLRKSKWPWGKKK